MPDDQIQPPLQLPVFPAIPLHLPFNILEYRILMVGPGENRPSRSQLLHQRPGKLKIRIGIGQVDPFAVFKGSALLRNGVTAPLEGHPWGDQWAPPKGAGNYNYVLKVD